MSILGKFNDLSYNLLYTLKKPFDTFSFKYNNKNLLKPRQEFLPTTIFADYWFPRIENFRMKSKKHIKHQEANCNLKLE